MFPYSLAQGPITLSPKLAATQWVFLISYYSHLLFCLLSLFSGTSVITLVPPRKSRIISLSSSHLMSNLNSTCNLSFPLLFKVTYSRFLGWGGGHFEAEGTIGPTTVGNLRITRISLTISDKHDFMSMQFFSTIHRENFTYMHHTWTIKKGDIFMEKGPVMDIYLVQKSSVVHWAQDLCCQLDSCKKKTSLKHETQFYFRGGLDITFTEENTWLIPYVKGTSSLGGVKGRLKLRRRKINSKN